MKQEYNIPHDLDAKGLRFAIVGSDCYQEAVTRMIEASEEVLLGAQAGQENIERYRVPGSFEIPVMCKHLCDQQRFDAILTFGIIIRGETAHFDQMVQSIPVALVHLSITTGVPILNEIIAADKEELVTARTQGQHNKGYEAGIAAVKIARSIQNCRKMGGER